MKDTRLKFRQKLLWLGVAALVVLHHDFWWWDDPSLLLGFLPVGLAYHVGFSLAASALWFAAVWFAWPAHVEEFANGGDAAPAKSKKSAP